MATRFNFGSEFINLRPDPPDPREYVGLLPFGRTVLDRRPLTGEEKRDAVENASQLQTFANTLFRRGGGYLYLTPGRYLVGRSSVAPVAGIRVEEFGDVVIPPDVTLWFAPGAVLVPLGDVPRPDGGLAHLPDRQQVRIEIQGDIIAEVEQIFDTLVNLAAPAGTVFLTGNRIREIYPEWWGANRDPLSDSAQSSGLNSLAIQAALDAGYNHRTTVRRDGTGAPRTDAGGSLLLHRRPAIPVVLRGTYDNAFELVAGAPRVGPSAPMVNLDGYVPKGGFELRGESPAGAPVKLNQTVAATGADFSVLAVRGPTSFVIDNLNFHGGNRARCATVEPVDAEWGYSSFDGCTFVDCLDTLVVLDAERLRRVRGPQATVWNSKRDFWNLTFTRCRFTPRNLTDTQHVEEGGAVALRLRLGDNEGVELRDCFFAGRASPSIMAFSGRFAINDTKFHCLRPAFLPTDPVRGASPNYSNSFRHGADVSIEPPDSPFAASLLGRAPGRLVPATFTARECNSHSGQFLVTSSSEMRSPDESRSAVILLNVQVSHEVVQAGYYETLRLTTPPAVYWNYPGTIGCPLITIGCSMLGPVAHPPIEAATDIWWHWRNRHAIYLAQGVTGEVYDVANNILGFDVSPRPGRTIYFEGPGRPVHVVRRLAGTTIGHISDAYR